MSPRKSQRTWRSTNTEMMIYLNWRAWVALCFCIRSWGICSPTWHWSKTERHWSVLRSTDCSRLPSVSAQVQRHIAIEACLHKFNFRGILHKPQNVFSNGGNKCFSYTDGLSSCGGKVIKIKYPVLFVHVENTPVFQPNSVKITNQTYLYLYIKYINWTLQNSLLLHAKEIKSIIINKYDMCLIYHVRYFTYSGILGTYLQTTCTWGLAWE